MAFETLLAPRRGSRSEPARDSDAGAGGGREWTPLTAIGLVAVIALVLVAGFVIGNGNGNGGSPQVVSVGGAAAGTAAGGGAVPAADTPARFTSDWPSGSKGYTVELGQLSKSGTSAAQVARAKSDARRKGAKQAGVLDSDAYASLPGGNYVIYSGVYDDKAAAAKALKGLKGAFPRARVVKVSEDAGGGPTSEKSDKGGTVKRQQLSKLDKLSGDDYVKQSKKLPDETEIGGKAPPKDDKAPGAGGQTVEIK